MQDITDPAIRAATSGFFIAISPNVSRPSSHYRIGAAARSGFHTLAHFAGFPIEKSRGAVFSPQHPGTRPRAGDFPDAPNSFLRGEQIVENAGKQLRHVETVFADYVFLMKNPLRISPRGLYGFHDDADVPLICPTRHCDFCPSHDEKLSPDPRPHIAADHALKEMADVFCGCRSGGAVRSVLRCGQS
jgi:hypothetical protein